MVPKINLVDKFSLIQQFWTPGIVAELNGQHVKLSKIKGEFDWHSHADEDELFLVVKGSFRMEFLDGSVELTEGEIIVVPRGVEHRPVAETECHILLFEPAGTLNTGDAESSLTVESPAWI